MLADTAGSSLAFREELDRRFSGLGVRIADRLRLGGWPVGHKVGTEAAAGLAAATARGIMLRARSGQSAADLALLGAAAVAALVQLSA